MRFFYDDNNSISGDGGNCSGGLLFNRKAVQGIEQAN